MPGSLKQAVPSAEAASMAQMHGLSLQHIYDTAPIGLALLSPDCRYLLINQHLTEICGISVEDHLGRTVRECVPALADSIETIVASIVSTGKSVTRVEVAGQVVVEGMPRSWITYWHPVHGPDGAIVAVNVAAEEITERKRAEAALRANELQFRTLADAMPQLVWMSDANGRIFWFSSRLEEFSALPAEAIPGRDWLEVLRSDAGDELWAASLAAGEPFEMELGLCGREGQCRPFLTRVVPLRDTSGVPYRWIGTHIDIDELKGRENQIRLIADEASHRNKNLLAVVMVIARQTARQADDIDEYLVSFAARLTALADCHELLIRDNWYGASFVELVEGQLRPFGEVNQGRIAAEGPPIILRPDAVQHLGLALHELATNAVKHGALGGTEGHVSIHWAIDPQAGKIHVHWSETGGPLVIPPGRRGFGRVVIEEIVPRALKGTGALDYAPEGLSWTFEFPAREANRT